MDKLEQEKLPEDMTDEEREEYLRKQEIYENAANTLQGAIACYDNIPRTAYGPPNAMPTGFPGMMLMNLGSVNGPSFIEPCAKWLEPGKWQCSCGSNNTSKFCPECGSSAPPPPWDCPNCGHKQNLGKFCVDCGGERPAANA